MEKKINVLELINFYIQRWWIMLIGILVGGLAFGAYTVGFITPMYQSACSFYAENTNDVLPQEITNVNLSAIMVRKELVATYAEILSSNVFLKKVAKESGLGYTHNELYPMLSMTSKNETEILVVKVKSPNPQHAYVLAQVISKLADEQISAVVDGGSVRVLDEPEFPERPYAPSKTRNVEIGMIAGLFLSMMLVFLIELIGNRVKNAEEITEAFHYPVLGEIPYYVFNNNNKSKGFNVLRTDVANN